MKTCFKCKEVKPLSDFYKHSHMADGYLGKCKVCTKADANKHRAENIDSIREYDRKRSKTPERLKLAAEVTKVWRSEDKRRTKCHNAVARAIKSGKLVKQSCKRCGSEKTEAHHENYDEPLNIVWLCSVCHKKRHNELKFLLLNGT